MNELHHASTLEAAMWLLRSWPAVGATARYSKVANENSDPGRLRQMRRWVVDVDELDDVHVPTAIANALINRVSHATRFQHFAYCGSLGPLRGGKITVERFDGYAWDCDPFLCWYECLANLSCADIKFRPDPRVPAEIMEGHPASKVVLGNADWDDQKYPSALDLAEFYGNRAIALKRHGSHDHALQSACFAIHLLQDMTIPQHVLSTIEHGHADFERTAESSWQRTFAGRSATHQRSVIQGQLSDDVLASLAALEQVQSFRQIGEFAVERTLATLITNRKDVAPPRGRDVYRLTTLGIACTVKALDLVAEGSA